MATYETRSAWEADQGGSAGGSILRSYFDLAAVGVADWSGGDASHLLTPDGGTVTDPVDFPAQDTANTTTFGPDGSTGIVIDSHTGDWDLNDPTCGTLRPTAADLLGITPDADTDAWFVMEMNFAAASSSEQAGLGVVEGVDMGAVCVRHNSGAKVSCVRKNIFVSPEIAESDPDVWVALRIHGDSLSYRYGVTGTDDLPTNWNDSGTAVGHHSHFISNPANPTVARDLNLALAEIILYHMDKTAGTAVVTLKSLRAYENVP